ncbi:DUF4238 domain-containing protein [Cryobacterium sp. HLT2-28]|uniref:DUF4238 domain-containing protein n=1 Tax=Cryobacterium sp. HLT2-28 TaxID=1259146 RepID=UPI00106AEC66|nr:DUF4238 domain-containing protein [Cryobacterium sp. HLT2-28]TFB94298.1 DUF4238 domain-containing protein [Cryobacterium sp. HLT2-28]
MTKRKRARPSPQKQPYELAAEAMTAAGQEPKGHHLMPGFYLERWAVNDRIRVTDMVNDRRTFELSPSKAARVNDFYRSEDHEAGDQSPVVYEAWLSEIEGKAAGVIAQILEDGINSMSAQQHSDLCHFLGMQITRTHAARIGRRSVATHGLAHHGALYIEGGTYCPATPKPFQNATKELLGNIIDTATYRERIKKRTAFQLHVKEKPDAKGRVVLRCPALGPSPTVTCPLRELLKSVKDKVRPAVDGENLPDFAEKICSQHSVSFDTANNRRNAQSFEYGTKEWNEFHTHARNSIESLNSQIKSNGPEDIESASRRRVRGFGAAQIIVSILLTNFNLRKIAAFISDKIKEEARKQVNGQPVVPPIRRRDREFHNPYTDTYPAGVMRPDKVKHVASDETGGPPLRT